EDGRHRSFQTPECAAFVFPAANGGLLCGLKSGLFHFECGTGQFSTLQTVDAQYPANRLNDGCIDAAGRLWFGTMDNEERDTSGSLYRYSGGSLAQMDDGYVITNGPAMSPDGRTLYHVDTVNRQLLAFDVDGSGALAGKRLFAQIERPGTYPD